MDHLANFAKHDIGNAIQNISANIFMIQDSISKESLEALKTSISNLEATVDNFGELIHVSSDSSFTIAKLIRATEVFVRSSVKLESIQFETDFDINDSTPISQPFQTLLQLIHNLIINAIKALRGLQKKIIRLEANIDNGWFVIKVKDTGNGIDDQTLPYIFDFGFTTTSGSGIGLFHAKNICEEIGGSIAIDRYEDNFSTIFTIKIPVNGDKKDTCD